ncbi:MAG TPA: plastocyanin/azurin family copper-binding protein [Solirubrobacteraceae bacterium]|nr:plastocyanin/azurin family copper-binding protein [Solirubrobacteraceae bacterium]
MLATAPSKVPFYIAGCLLALWAVLLAVWGISHAEFPGSESRGRLVMVTSFVLVAATLTAAVLTGGGEHAEGGAGAAEAPPRATGRLLELAADPGGALSFDKSRAAVLAGQVTVRLTNDSAVEHNVTIAQGSKNLGATKTITRSSSTLELGLQRGDFVFYCSVPGHRASGMEGTLAVE